MITKLKPTAQDAVLGGQVPPPLGAVVLGGLEGVKCRLSSPAIAPRIAALREALNYGATGLELILRGLEDESLKVQRTALLLLWRRPESHIRQALANYSQYHLFDIVDTLQGHSEAIATLALSSNGRILYSAGADFTIKVWDLGKDQTQHKQMVAITPDGKTLVTGSQDTTIKHWDIRTGTEIRTLRGHTSLVDSVALSPDGKALASCSWDTTIRVWDLISGKQRWEFIGHSARVLSFAISPDGRTLVSGSLDTRIKVWDLQTGKAIRTLEGHWGWVKSLVISRDGKTLISASYKEIRVWNLETGEPIQVLNGHINLINAIALSPDGQTLVSGGEDCNIHVWSIP